MNKRFLLLLCAGCVLAFTLGRFSRPAPVHAQNGMKVYIKEDSSPGMGYSSVPSTQMVGFSCVDERSKDETLPDVHCYIAYIQ